MTDHTRSEILLRINNVIHRLSVDNRRTLLDALRDDLGITGPKKGCDHGQCGACTVLRDGRRVVSCLTLAVAADAAAITTVEGLAAEGELQPIQEACVRLDGFQSRLVDVRQLPLDGVRDAPDGGLVIGATTTNSDAAAHPEVRRRFPALTQAVLAGASGQLRNMATVGGNLLQRTPFPAPRSCATRSRRQGQAPDGVDLRSSLDPDPSPALATTEPGNQEKPVRPPRAHGLTRPHSFRDDLPKQTSAGGGGYRCVPLHAVRCSWALFGAPGCSHPAPVIRRESRVRRGEGTGAITLLGLS